jgi:hypothetical protein
LPQVACKNRLSVAKCLLQTRVFSEMPEGEGQLMRTTSAFCERGFFLSVDSAEELV